MWKTIYKKIDDVFDEEYKVEASAKRKEVKETEKKGEEKKNEEEKDGDEGRVEEENKEEEENTTKGEEKAIDEQQEKSVQDTQLPPPSPPHATITPVETMIVKDVIDTSCQNINPLNIEDLSKILDQSTQQAQLCTNPVLVSVDELQKVVADLKEVKVKTQEPPSTFKTIELLLLSSVQCTLYFIYLFNYEGVGFIGGNNNLFVKLRISIVKYLGYLFGAQSWCLNLHGYHISSRLLKSLSGSTYFW